MNRTRSWVCAAVVCGGVWLAAGAGAAQFGEVDGHVPVAAGEHPRLLLRGSKAVEVVRAAAKTDWGRQVDARMRQSLKLMALATRTGQNRVVLKEAGYRAAGHATVYLLEGDQAAADEAWNTLDRELIRYPSMLLQRLQPLDRASRLMGAALAYDMAYEGWSEDRRQQARAFLRKESDALLAQVDGIGAFDAGSELHAMVVGSAGVADLAMVADLDDAGAEKRLAAIEAVVIRYLEESVGEEGFGVAGEAVKQAAFASGLIPFLRANRLVRGRDLVSHPAVGQVLRPAVFTTVAKVGMPVVGGYSSSEDRSGLFGAAGDRVPEDQRPQLAWLFEVLGGRDYLGVVRPHQGLDMLTSDLGTLAAAAPGGEAWPRMVVSDGAGVVVMRSGWEGPDDLVTLLDDGRLRITGMGARWVTFPGPHVGIYSHERGTAGLDNRFGFSRLWAPPPPPVVETADGKKAKPAKVKPAKVFDPSMSVGMGRMAWDDEARSGSAVYSVSGEVRRTKPKLVIRRKRPKPDEPKEDVFEVPDGGRFSGKRVVGVDYSGRSGVPGLWVLADRIDGAPKHRRHWVLNLGYVDRESRPQVDGNTFTQTLGDLTLTGTIVHPADATFLVSAAPPVFNVVSVQTLDPSVVVVLTLGRGTAPKVSGGGAGQPIRVGKVTCRVSDDAIVFE